MSDRTTALLIPHGFETNYIVGFARGLAANGVKFSVVSSDESAARLQSVGIAQFNLRGSQGLSRPGWRKAANLVRYYLLLARAVVRHRRSTIHFNGLLTSRIILWDGLVIPLWLRFWAGRYIHTAHNALPHGRENSRLFRWAYRWIYRFPHVIVAHSNKVARQLEVEFGVSPDRIVVISIGLNEEIPETALSVADTRRQLGLPEQGPLALFFGKVERYKGVDVLAEAWGRIRTSDARLVIAGWSSDVAYAEEVRHAIARSPRTTTMQWREGFVPNEEVGVWLKACDVVVMPYRNIYQSGVVFLCLRFGVPIVATDVGSMAEFIDVDSGILAATNDSAGIAAALDLFFAKRGRFRREAIARRAASYRWENQCRAIKHLYQ
jgi:glycosyltransferase involved in cell wall biosynthesis